MTSHVTTQVSGFILFFFVSLRQVFFSSFFRNIFLLFRQYDLSRGLKYPCVFRFGQACVRPMVYTHKNTHTYTHTHIIYIYTHTHVHIYTHIHSASAQPSAPATPSTTRNAPNNSTNHAPDAVPSAIYITNKIAIAETSPHCNIASGAKS
jgi:hypothetical protein